MSLPKVILVPTDFSAAAEAAFDRAVELAAKVGARIYLMHAYQLPVVGGTSFPTAEIESKIIGWAQGELNASAAKRKGSGVEVVPLLREADPRVAALAAAEEIEADLVVMGTHGRSGIARALIGSVAESLIRSSPVPVMTVRAAG